MHGVIGDFERHLGRVPAGRRPAHRRLPRRHDRQLPARAAAAACCARSRGLLGPEDHLLLGTDLVKDPEVLQAAYDDTQGVTAEFNRNVLRVLNRELDADFDPEDFDHVALFDAEHEWIEMRLRARREHTTLVRELDLPVHFDAGEEMRTEISAKFTPERMRGRSGGGRPRAGALVHRPRRAVRADARRVTGRAAGRGARSPAAPSVG